MGEPTGMLLDQVLAPVDGEHARAQALQRQRDGGAEPAQADHQHRVGASRAFHCPSSCRTCRMRDQAADRKSTRLNSSHVAISYAVFSLKKKIAGKERLPPTSALGRLAGAVID